MSCNINKNQALGYLEWDDFRGHLERIRLFRVQKLL